MGVALSAANVVDEANIGVDDSNKQLGEVYLPVYMSICLFVCLTGCVCVCVCVCVYFLLSVYQTIDLSIYLCL